MRTFFPLMDAATGSSAGGGGGANAGAAVAAGAPAAGAGTTAAGAADGAGASPAAGATAGSSAAADLPPWHSALLTPTGEINRDVVSRMPEHLRPIFDGELKNAKTFEDVFKKVDGLSKLAGKKALAPLPTDATPEMRAERDSVLRLINGVPDKPEGYGVERPIDLPEEAWNKEAATEALAIMHRGNVPPAIAKELVASQVKHTQAMIKASEDQAKQWFDGQEAAFRESMIKQGIAPDKGLDLALRAAKTYGIDPGNPVFKNAMVRNALYKMAVATGESRLVTGDAAAGGNTKSPGELAKDMIHNKANPDHAALTNNQDGRHREVKQRYTDLMIAQSQLDQQKEIGAVR